MDSLQATEAASAAVAKSPDTRVKLADIEAAIAATIFLGGPAAVRAGILVEAGDTDEVYRAAHAAAQNALVPLTICILVMRNGFAVIGKSAPADPANFDAALGCKFAREDAVRQLWPLMGFSLRDRLASLEGSV